MPTLTNRTARKGLVEAAVAVAAFALTYVSDHVGLWNLDPTVYGIVQAAAQVALQALRRVARDSRNGTEPA